MIIFRPHFLGGTLEESMEKTREFLNINELKIYIYNSWNYEKEFFSIDDIIILEEPIINDDRIGWEDTKYVCIKRFGDTDYIKENGVPACIGYCSSKYKKSKEVVTLQNICRNNTENNGNVLTKKVTPSKIKKL